MIKNWRKNRNERKNAFETFTRCGTLADLYTQWVEQDTPYIPRKFRHKKINGEEENETELRQQLSIEKVKTEIKILQQRKTKFEKKFSDLDQTMLETIDENASGSVAEKLRDIWMKDCNGDIEKVNDTWQKKKEWFLQTKAESEAREANPANQEATGNQGAIQVATRRTRGVGKRQRVPGYAQRRQDTSEFVQRRQGTPVNGQGHQGMPGRRGNASGGPRARRYLQRVCSIKPNIQKNYRRPTSRSRTRNASQQRRVTFNFNQQQARGRQRYKSNSSGYSQGRSPGNRKPNYDRSSNRNQPKVGQSHFFQQAGLPPNRR